MNRPGKSGTEKMSDNTVQQGTAQVAGHSGAHLHFGMQHPHVQPQTDNQFSKEAGNPDSSSGKDEYISKEGTLMASAAGSGLPKTYFCPPQIIASSTTTVAELSSHAVLAPQNKLWPNGHRFTYGFLDGGSYQHKKVSTIIREWSKYGNFSFKEIIDNPKSAEIRITFNPDEGSWSLVGLDCLVPDFSNEATMNFGWVNNVSKINEEDIGVILHEFGHTLGLLHEHQSPARNKTLTLNLDKVYPYYQKSQNWTKEMVDSQVVKMYSKSEVSNYSSLDTTSIMMYFMSADLNEENIEVPPNNSLSKMDIAFIIANYPYPNKVYASNVNENEWSLERALDIIGITNTNNNRASLLSSAAKNKVDRNLLTNEINKLRLKNTTQNVQLGEYTNLLEMWTKQLNQGLLTSEEFNALKANAKQKYPHT